MARTAGRATVAVDVATDGVRVPVARERIARLARDVLRAERVRAAELSITFVSAERIAELNRKHLRHRGPTDIITFELQSTRGGPATADIYISPEIARENAASNGCGVREEIARLVVHGALHALGREHPDGDARTSSPMWRRQEQLVERLWRRERRT
jgi:probable rRNA maturation factor